MTGTFIDTIVVCTMTGLVLIVTGAWHSGAEVAALTKSAFDIGLPGNRGSFIVSFRTRVTPLRGKFLDQMIPLTRLQPLP